MYAILNPYTDLEPRHCRDMNPKELDAFLERGPSERERRVAAAIARLVAIFSDEDDEHRRIEGAPRSRSTR